MAQEGRFTMKYYLSNDPYKNRHIRSVAKKTTLRPRTIFYGYQIIHWDQLNAKRFCPEKKKKKKKKNNTLFGYVKSPRFHGNPLYDFE